MGASPLLLFKSRNFRRAPSFSSCDLKKKSPYWDRKSVDDHGSTTRALFMEENTDGEI